jgi:ketosteroid isomerase-like protein
VTLSPADRLDILDLLTRADAAASARDPDAYLALFTGDAVLDGDQGDYRGTAALRRGLAAVWGAEPAGTLHLTLNPVIEPGAGDGLAVTRSVLLIVDPGPPPAIRVTAMITQELRRSDGSWRISRRTVAPPGRTDGQSQAG